MTEPPVLAPVVQGDPVEIEQGVHVIGDGGVPLVPNIAVVVGARAALVVDTGMGARNGGFVFEHAAALAGQRRLLLTLTHFHPEHGFGAQAFAGAAAIVYNREQRDELRQKGQAYLEMFRTFGDHIAGELEGVELVEPDVVYEEKADVELGGTTAELRACGLGHTRGDQIVHLPNERILITGDLAENGLFPIFPYFPPEDVDIDGGRWIEVLERLERLEPRIVVPGHGPIGDAGILARTRECLAALRTETRLRRQEGHPLDDTVVELDLEFRARYPGWQQPEWIGFAVRSFYDSDS